MATPNVATDRLRLLLLKHNGMLRMSDALRHGVSRTALYALRDAGEIAPISRGLYRLSMLSPLAHPDLVTVAAKIPSAVICLVSALAHYDLTTQIPHEVQLALERGSAIPRLAHPPTRIFWFSGRAFSEGVQTIELDRTPVRVYSPEKTVADCFKYRNKLGMDVVIEALRLWREKRERRHLGELLEHARTCRVEKVMRPYLEAVL
jgi:predicted transcriptional regulator of viral defense system